MGMRAMMLVLGVGLCAVSFVPSVWAADEHTAEAAEAGSPSEVTPLDVEQLRSAVAAEPDSELREAMQEQLELLESGQLDLERELALGAPELGTPAGGAPDLISPPVNGDTSHMPSSMTPELREQLFNVYEQVAAGGLSEQEARTQAEGILREHGVDPSEMGGPEHDREFGEQQYKEAFERMSPEALEHMSPEAREQMEQYREQAEQYREQAEQYREQMEQNYSAPEHEFEAMTHEYEATTHEYETPTHEYEATTHEYEAPEPMDAPEGAQEAPEYDAPEQPEFNAPEGGQHEYQPPQP